MSSSTEEGNDHTCPDCGAKWWDSDGGCSCTKCRHCDDVGDEDFAPDGYCADCIPFEIVHLKANRIILQNRIRALEFQNAELRAKA